MSANRDTLAKLHTHIHTLIHIHIHTHSYTHSYTHTHKVREVIHSFSFSCWQIGNLNKTAEISTQISDVLEDDEVFVPLDKVIF